MKKVRSLPIFRLSKAFGVGRDMNVFFDLKGGLIRGTVPDLKHQEEQAEDLRKALTRNRKQTRTLRRQRLEISQLRNELRAVKEQAEGASDDLLAPQAMGKPESGALPDFVIVGAQKCGTTSLYDLLTQHPYVERAPVKEVHFFNRPNRFERGVEWYRQCFPPPTWKDGRRTITGEATPYYLFHPHAAERMAGVVPQARLIALLRNPVDRAYSHYYMQRRIGHETASFEEAVERETAQLLDGENESPDHGRHADAGRDSSNLLARGIYVDQLLRWSKFFSDEQMLVLKSEYFFERPAETLKVVFDFLDLPQWEPPAFEVRNKGDYDPMDPEIRRRLEAFFEPHNQRLYRYLGADFGW